MIPLLSRPKEYTDSVKEEYQKRRDIIMKGLDKMEGVTYVAPNGAFYCIVALPIENAEDFVTFMLNDFNDNNQTVMVSPAEGFYKTPGIGVNQIRLAFVLDEPELERAMEILKLGLIKYKSKCQ